MKIGFDNEKYLKMQSEHIRNRIGKFGGKLYLEFGGKLFDDYHASRVLPGFEPDSKLRLLKELSDQAEIVFAISAKDIEKNKIRGDLGITYDSDVIRLIGTYREQGLVCRQCCYYAVLRTGKCPFVQAPPGKAEYPGLYRIIIFLDILPIFLSLSVMKAMAKMIISKLPIRWSS